MQVLLGPILSVLSIISVGLSARQGSTRAQQGSPYPEYKLLNMGRADIFNIYAHLIKGLKQYTQHMLY